MRTYQEDDDREEAERMGAEQWMLDCLKINPDYVHWGPHEDYMADGGESWRSAIMLKSWSEMFDLDDLNEVVHFYFSVNRDGEDCERCGGSGHNPETKQIADDWYDFAGTGRRWCDSLTQDEVDALVEKNRLFDLTRRFVEGEGWKENDPPTRPTAEQVNERSASRKGIGHDAINRWICVETRAKRLGVWGNCEHCEGHGSVFTAPAATLRLTLWLLHPRKGASRGVEIADVKQDELAVVFAFLRKAARRNAERFAKIPA